jgi:phospholipase/lecithinase/hemolysin
MTFAPFTLLCRTLLLALGAFLTQAIITQANQALYARMYVFGDSYSDIGEGYLDGNGPTAVAYLAQRLGFPLLQANDPAAAGKSLDFAISGARTGSGPGEKVGDALLGFGMRNQVDDFAAKVHSHAIEFDGKTTLFFIVGGLNDKTLPTGETVKNLEGEIRTLYGLGGRNFMVALLPAAIPGFSEVSLRLNPALAAIPKDLKSEFPDAQVRLSHWGLYFDDVMQHPAQYGIQNTTDPCAGRAIFHEDTTPCAAPSTYFFYHHGHPSTAVHKIVGDKLYDEITALTTHPGHGR